MIIQVIPFFGTVCRTQKIAKIIGRFIFIKKNDNMKTFEELDISKSTRKLKYPLKPLHQWNGPDFGYTNSYPNFCNHF